MSVVKSVSSFLEVIKEVYEVAPSMEEHSDDEGVNVEKNLFYGRDSGCGKYSHYEINSSLG